MEETNEILKSINNNLARIAAAQIVISEELNIIRNIAESKCGMQPCSEPYDCFIDEYVDMAQMVKGSCAVPGFIVD